MKQIRLYISEKLLYVAFIIMPHSYEKNQFAIFLKDYAIDKLIKKP